MVFWLEQKFLKKKTQITQKDKINDFKWLSFLPSTSFHLHWFYHLWQKALQNLLKLKQKQNAFSSQKYTTEKQSKLILSWRLWNKREEFFFKMIQKLYNKWLTNYHPTFIKKTMYLYEIVRQTQSEEWVRWS